MQDAVSSQQVMELLEKHYAIDASVPGCIPIVPDGAAVAVLLFSACVPEWLPGGEAVLESLEQAKDVSVWLSDEDFCSVDLLIIAACDETRAMQLARRAMPFAGKVVCEYRLALSLLF